jgi:hypothetical protein
VEVAEVDVDTSPSQAVEEAEPVEEEGGPDPSVVDVAECQPETLKGEAKGT